MNSQPTGGHPDTAPVAMDSVDCPLSLSCQQIPPGSYSSSATTLFNEAVSFYIKTMRNRGLLVDDDKATFLLAIHGLIALNAYHLAKVLIRIGFSNFTADDYSSVLTDAKRIRRFYDCQSPF